MEFDKLLGFDWDKGNILKNWEKHKVKHAETEEVFINEPKFIYEDEKHSTSERRYLILGRTNSGRKLAVFFTFREDNIRVISARDMNKKERSNYEQKI